MCQTCFELSPLNFWFVEYPVAFRALRIVNFVRYFNTRERANVRIGIYVSLLAAAVWRVKASEKRP